MTHTYHAPDAATLRADLLSHGILKSMWSGFHWACKFGPHIRRDGSGTFELTITANGTGYDWSLVRVLPSV